MPPPTVEVKLASRDMEAFLTLTRTGPHEVTRETLVRCLRDKGVVHGIDNQAIDTLVEALGRGEKVGTRIRVAAGTRPQRSVAAEIEPCFDTGALVGRGEILARQVGGSPPRDGKTVTGKVIAAPRDAQLKPAAGEHVEYVEEERLWKSLLPGYPALEARGVHLTPLVLVAEDRMTATLTLRPVPAGTAAPEETTVRQMIEEAGVVFGLRDEALSGLLESLAARPNGTVSGVIARGKRPVDGDDGKIRLMAAVGSATRQETRDGRIDFHSIQRMRDVKEGELLAIKTLPTAGSPGRYVTGETIPSRGGKEFRATAGDNVEVSDDGLEFHAAIDGLFHADKLHFRVLDLYVVQGDVDYGTGDIESRKEVHVRGTIRSTFSVSAGGAIVVEGMIEDAIVESGASIEVKGGISHKAVGSVTARECVEAKYALNAQIRALDSIVVRDSALHCFLVAGKALTVLDGAGTVVGGHAIAGERLAVKIAGSQLDVKTVLQVGLDFQSLEPIEKQLRSLEQEMARLLSLVGHDIPQYASGAKSAPTAGRLTEHVRRWRTCERRRESLLKRRSEILERTARSTREDPSILVEQTLYPGVHLIIGEASLCVTEKLPGGRFVIDSETHRIERESIDAPSRATP